MNMEILNAKHHFVYIYFFLSFYFMWFFILWFLFYFCNSTFLNCFSLFLLSRNVVFLVIVQVLSRAYWLWWCLSHPLTLKILFLLLVMFCWFCDFLHQKYRTMCYLFILKQYKHTRDKKKHMQWKGMREEDINKEIIPKVWTHYSSSKFAISSSNRLIFLSIMSIASSSTSHLADRTILSSKNTLWQTMSDSMSNCSVNPQQCLGDGDWTRWDDEACDDWKASITNANQCKQ